jgi:hypothetical protein
LIKPQSFMNKSGLSVAEIARFYKIPAGDIFVFYDEIDLAVAKMRLKQGGDMAGITAFAISIAIWALITGACASALADHRRALT